MKGDVYERALSERQAWNCEHALELRCRCRCGGERHGAKRVQSPDELHTLPVDDPHFFFEEKPSKLGPMRKVVDRIRTAYGWRGKKFSVKLILECGHSVWRKGSRFTEAGKKKFLKSRLKRVHCPTCLSSPAGVAHKKNSPILPANRWVRKTQHPR